MDDPKIRQRPREGDDAPPAPQFIALTPEQFAALTGTRQDSDEFLRKQAQYQAEANKRALRPENDTHPGISAFSYPEGDIARPKPDLQCKMTWVGYPLDKDGLTPEEVALLNQIDMVGEFAFHKTDGSLEKATIRGEKDAHGRWSSLHIAFPCRGSNRHNQPTMVALLRELLAQMPARAVA